MFEIIFLTETTLDSNLKDDSIDLHSFEEIEDIISERTFRRHLHLNIVYQQTKLYQREREIRGLIEKMIDSILVEKSFPSSTTEIKKDLHMTEQSNSHIFIDQLLHLTQDGRPLTPLEIRQNVIAIIFAVSFNLYADIIITISSSLRDMKQQLSPLRMQF